MKCVYSHSLNGIIFYIGSGSKSRPYNKNGRNKLWLKKVKENNGVYHVSVLSYHEDSIAHLYESKAIKKYNPECNINSKFGVGCNVVCFEVEKHHENKMNHKKSSIRKLLLNSKNSFINSTIKPIGKYGDKKKIRIRVTAEDKNKIKILADKNNMSVNLYCRNALMPIINSQ